MVIDFCCQAVQQYGTICFASHDLLIASVANLRCCLISCIHTTDSIKPYAGNHLLTLADNMSCLAD